VGVGNAEHLDDALDRAVFAADPVQGIEDHVGARLERAQQCRQVAADINHPHPVTAIG